VEENNVDTSDARTGSFKSYSDDFYDYGDDKYKPRKTKKVYVPVFVGEKEKKKSKALISIGFTC